MSLDSLSKQISLKAQKEISKLDLSFEDDCRNIEREFNSNLDIYKLDLVNKNNIETDIIKVKVLGKAKKIAKEKLLNTKRDLLNEVYMGVIDNLNNYSPKQRYSLFKSLILNNSDFKFNKIITERKNARIFKEISEDLFGYEEGKLIKVQVQDSINGFILSNGDFQRLDLTYESLVNELFIKKDELIQRRLFM